MRRAAILVVRAYQRVCSPYLLATCRFTPSCSQYSLEAIQRHGVFKGTWLGLKRLARCQPLGGRGYDPVP